MGGRRVRMDAWLIAPSIGKNLGYICLFTSTIVL